MDRGGGLGEHLGNDLECGRLDAVGLDHDVAYRARGLDGGYLFDSINDGVAAVYGFNVEVFGVFFSACSHETICGSHETKGRLGEPQRPLA